MEVAAQSLFGPPGGRNCIIKEEGKTPYMAG